MSTQPANHIVNHKQPVLLHCNRVCLNQCNQHGHTQPGTLIQVCGANVPVYVPYPLSTPCRKASCTSQPTTGPTKPGPQQLQIHMPDSKAAMTCRPRSALANFTFRLVLTHSKARQPARRVQSKSLSSQGSRNRAIMPAPIQKKSCGGSTGSGVLLERCALLLASPLPSLA